MKPNDNYSSGAAGGMSRQRKYVACVVVILAIGVSLCSYTFSFYRKVAICQELEDTLESMAQTPPENFDARAWEVIVAWTANLHINSHAYSADTDDVARLLSDLKRKVDKELPDLDTIEWIWSEYADLTPQGMNHQRFKSGMYSEVEARFGIAPTGDN